jgi:hypothetical protein
MLENLKNEDCVKAVFRNPGKLRRTGRFDKINPVLQPGPCNFLPDMIQLAFLDIQRDNPAPASDRARCRYGDAAYPATEIQHCMSFPDSQVPQKLHSCPRQPAFDISFAETQHCSNFRCNHKNLSPFTAHL